MGFKLMNAESQHRRYPDSFWIPEREERRRLSPGDQVKLVFQPSPPRAGGPNGERMWVEVEEIRADGRYHGKLLNEPVVLDGAHWGDTVGFGPEHVISIDTTASRMTRNVIGGALLVAGAYGLYRLLRPAQAATSAPQQSAQPQSSQNYLVLT